MSAPKFGTNTRFLEEKKATKSKKKKKKLLCGPIWAFTIKNRFYDQSVLRCVVVSIFVTKSQVGIPVGIPSTRVMFEVPSQRKTTLCEKCP